MSWEEEMFAYLEDLEGRASALYDAERASELADRSRAEYQQVSIASRLAASAGLDVTLWLRGVGAVPGRVVRVATGWCHLTGAGQDWVVRLEAIAAASGASERALPEVAWPAAARLGLGAPLRRLAEEAEPCLVHLTDGRRFDGTLRRAGADFVELAAGEPGRVVLVTYAHLAAVQSRR